MQYLGAMRTELQSIINDFDYSKALTWFKTHVQGKFFIKEVLSKGEDAFNIITLKKELNTALASLPVPKSVTQFTADELKSELENLAEDLKEKLREEASQIFLENQKRPSQIVEKAASSREELQLDEQWKPIYKKANFIFSRLIFAESDEKRKEMAFEILNLMDEVEISWKDKDFLRKHGRLPAFDNAGLDEMTPQQHARRISTIRTYISKARKGILNESKIPMWEKEITEHEIRLR